MLHSIELCQNGSSSGLSNVKASPSTQPWPVQGSASFRLMQERLNSLRPSSPRLCIAMKVATEGAQAKPK